MEIPPWLTVMCNSEFFEYCTAHEDERINRFCTDCVESLCSHCLSEHDDHHCIIKIRRYVYNNVVNKEDLHNKFFNCHSIQTYWTNNSKVIYLKQREKGPQQQQNNTKGYSCTICYRGLNDPSSYCSILCKILDKFKGKGEEKDNEIALSEKEEEDLFDNNTDKEEAALKRKRSRKGIPHRAPLLYGFMQN